MIIASPMNLPLKLRRMRQKSFNIVKDFNDKGGIVKTGYVGDDKSQWANWKISNVVKI